MAPTLVETESGPVVKNVKPGEPLDVTELRGYSDAPLDPDKVGDTAREPGDQDHALVDTSAETAVEVDPKKTGDRIKKDYVGLVDVPEGSQTATATQLKKAGYVVPADAKPNETPAQYAADTPTPPGEVHLVQNTSTAFDGLTPEERIRRDSAAMKPARTAKPKPKPKARAKRTAKAKSTAKAKTTATAKSSAKKPTG